MSVRNTDILKNCHKYVVCILITEYVKGLLLYSCFKTEALGQLGNGLYPVVLSNLIFLLCVQESQAAEKATQFGIPWKYS